MKIVSKAEFLTEESNTGFLILLYGPTGVGKSVSTIQTSPEPILYVCCESRDPGKFLREARRPEVDIDFVFYNTWEEMLEFFAHTDNFTRYKTIIIDSVTFLTLGISQEIEDENYEASKGKRGEDKPLTMSTKLSQEGYGAMASHMLRFTKLCGRITQLGKTVVMIALMSENPSYKREFNAAPLLEGRKYGLNLPGFCDMIGMVEERQADDGEVLYPPIVRFDGSDWFMHKRYGEVKAGPLNIAKIIEVATKTIPVEKKKKGGQ